MLNAPGENMVPECADGFANVAVAKTRILQGGHTQITGYREVRIFLSAASTPGCG
jgi:hypothetical protein